MRVLGRRKNSVRRLVLIYIPGGERANEFSSGLFGVPDGGIQPKKGLAGDLPRVCFFFRMVKKCPLVLM